MSSKTAPHVDPETGVRADAALVPPPADDLPEFADAPSLEVVRRSTLQNYADCPAMAVMVERGLVLNSGRAALVGQEGHDAMAEGVDGYVKSSGFVKAADIADTIHGRLLQSRPDIQSDVIDAAWFAAWPFAKFLDDLNPANIKRYDGGTGERSGQLAWDLPTFGCRTTAEVDFLYVGHSKKALHEIDFKTGWTTFNANTIWGSFQFQMHAWLVFLNYPEVEELEVSIWRTRTNDLSKPVTFDKSDFGRFDMRIKHAAMLWQQHRHARPETAIAHPSVEGCDLCPARSLCTVVPREEVDNDPADFVRRLWALDSKVAEMKKKAEAYVTRTQQDIVTDDGMAFGFDKPKAERKATGTLYSTK